MESIPLITRDREFYRSLVRLAIPVALQNLITFSVNFADNLMVGTLPVKDEGESDRIKLAVMKLLTVSKWIPTVAEIREKVQSLYYEALELMPDAIEREYLDEAKRQRNTAIANDILEKTNHLRGDSTPELTLRAIVNNPQYAQLMAGNRDVLGMTGQTFRIEDGKEELRGEAYRISDGNMLQISKANDIIKL